MATSEPDRLPTAGGGSAGFWASPVGRYLVSRKNLAGLVAAVLAILVHLVVGIGMLWPLVVCGCYALAAVVTPSDPPPLSLAPTGPSAGELRARLDHECGRLQALRPGAAAAADLDRLHSAVADVLGRWEVLVAAPGQRVLVESIVQDYLPGAIDGYGDIPAGLRSSSPGPGRSSAQDELVSSLGLLRDGAEEIRSAVLEDDVERLRNQGRFLRQKFGRSELEL